MSTTTLPSQVLIIRHGEKLGDPKKDNDGGRHLSIRGSARAAALPSLFDPAQPQLACKLYHKAEEVIAGYRQVPVKGPTQRLLSPNYVFATEASRDSKRPIETVAPLATAFNVPVNDCFGDDDEDMKEMTNAILQEFPGKIILVCWHHGRIPEIAKALGIAKPPKWDGKIFDRVWQITFPKGKATLTDLPQMLLYGDSAK
jgi:broad specificity phosphatase PhoE